MYLYNISVIIEDNMDDAVIDWIKSNFLSTSEIQFRLLHLLDSPHPGSTICIQLQASSEDLINEIREIHLAQFQEFIQNNYPEKIFLFDSVMQYLVTD